MGSLVFFIQICVVVCIIIVAGRKQAAKKNDKKPYMRKPSTLPPQGRANAGKRRTALRYNAEEGNAFVDDKNNDWLAKQLEEEKKIQGRLSEMFGLRYNAKKDHEANCDAARIKKEHEKNCNADGIDTAKGR